MIIKGFEFWNNRGIEIERDNCFFNKRLFKGVKCFFKIEVE